MPEMRRTGFGRLARIGRRAGLASLAAAALMAGPVDGPGAVAQELKELSVSVGRQPWAAGNSPITQHMIDSELFEKQARELGYDLTIDYRDYPSAMPQVEAFVGGNLDFGMWGNTPIIRGIAQGQPWTVLNVGEGHFRFIIVVRPDSDIRNVQDLRGKTIGALFGGDPYNALSQILLGELGSGDPRELGINIVNMPSGAQAATVPQGVDAAVTTSPHFLKARVEVGTVGIVNSFGYTEELAQGFDAVKIGPFDEVRDRTVAAADQLRSAGEGLARVAAVRAALGPYVRLMVDCHWRFSAAAAAALIPEFAALGVWWLECPMPEVEDDVGPIRRLRGLANERGMALAGCESKTGVGGFRPWLDAEAYDVVMPDVKHVGRLGDLLLIDELACARSITLAPHNPSGPVAHAVSVHMSTLLESFLILEQQFDESPRFAAIVDGAIATSNGRAVPPRGYGLGVRLKPGEVQLWQDRGA